MTARGSGHRARPRIAIGTIVAKNYVSHARVLADSLRCQHPDVPFYVLLADDVDGAFDPAAEPYTMLTLRACELERIVRFADQSTPQAIAVAAKPVLLARLLEYGFDAALFLDPDILIVADLTPVFDPLHRHPVLLTPHLLAPVQGSNRIARDLNILQSGIFNGGVLGVSRSATAQAFLAWLDDRLAAVCEHAVDRGAYFDQRWLDLAPSYFPDVGQLRDPGCNVGHWNLPDRHVTMDGDSFLVDGHPLRLFHFSGFDPAHPHIVSRHLAHLAHLELGLLEALFDRYAALLDAAGYQQTRRWPFAYARLESSTAR